MHALHRLRVSLVAGCCYQKVNVESCKCVMAADATRNQHLQRALLGLRQLSVTLRTVSGSLGTTSHPLADDGTDGHSLAHANGNAQHVQPGSRNRQYAAQARTTSPASRIGACSIGALVGNHHTFSGLQVAQFRHELRHGGPIDMGNLRAFAFHGIPDGDRLRATAWKVRMLQKVE